MSPDGINGCFEVLGGFMLAKHCVQLYRDKEVKGVSILPVAFFMSWGWWNLYFYPSVGAWWSFYGGLAVVLANTTWLGQMIYYRHQRIADKNPGARRPPSTISPKVQGSVDRAQERIRMTQP